MLTSSIWLLIFSDFQTMMYNSATIDKQSICSEREKDQFEVASLINVGETLETSIMLFSLFKLPDPIC